MTSRRTPEPRPRVGARAPGSSGTPRRSVYDPAGQGSSGRAAPRGPRLGPVAITPLRATLGVALLGGVGFLCWSLLERDKLQIPLMATGFAIIGLVLAAMAILSVVRIIQAGHERRDGLAVVTALVGGVLAMGAMLSLAAAIIFAMIWSGTAAG